jgi:hypothetical protein
VRVAGWVGDEPGQVFGIAELGQLSRGGQIRTPYWNRDWQPLIRAWAAEHGIDLIDETLTG